MGTMIVVGALVVLACSEILFARIQRARGPSEAIDQVEEVDEVSFEPQSTDRPEEDYSDLTPAEIRQRAKARLGPRAW